MTEVIPLNENVQVTLNGSGNGTVTIGPTSPFQKWLPTMAACKVSSNAAEPQFLLYNGNGPSGQFLGGTNTGSNDSTGLNGVVLYPNTKLFGQWIGGDPGAIATLSITGTMEVP